MKIKESNHTYIYEASGQDDGKKLVDYLRETHLYSHRLINSIKKEGSVYVNDNKTKFNHILKEKDSIIIDFGKEKYDAECVEIDFETVYEDDDVLLINKPANLITHPTKYHQRDTLANGIYYMWSKKNLLCKARFVNRLDMDTSGIVLVAKNKYAHHFIQLQMQKGQIEKTYYALAEGIISESNGVIDAPIAKNEQNGMARSVCEAGKQSITEYEVIDRHKDFTFIKIFLRTGRTHQIRVHMRHISHPLLGDVLYNKQSDLISRQALHAYSIGFIHPRSKQYNVFTAKIPDDINKLLK